MSTRLDRCAPTATKTASKPPSSPLGGEVLDRWSQRHRARRAPRSGRSRRRARRAAAGRPGCRSASSRRARRRRRGSRPRGRGGPGGRRPTARSGRRRSTSTRLPLRGRRRVELPALLEREVAEEALDRVDRDGAVEARRGCRRSRTGGSRRGRGSRAAGCPRRAARHACSCRPGLRVREPGLDVLAGRAAGVARRQQVDVDGPALAHGPGVGAAVQQVGQRRHIAHRFAHCRCDDRAAMSPTLALLGETQTSLNPTAGCGKSADLPHRRPAVPSPKGFGRRGRSWPMRLVAFRRGGLRDPRCSSFWARRSPCMPAPCRSGPAELRVTERDFHISAPKQVASGDLTLTVVNQGPDDHELIIVRATTARLPLRSDGLTANEEKLSPIIALSLGPGRAGHGAHVPPATSARPLRALLQHGGALHGRHADDAGRAVAMSRLRASGKAAALRPFAARSRSPIAAILVVFALFSAVSVGLSIRSTSGSRHSAAVVEVAARQRTLAERYVKAVLLVRQGRRSRPALHGRHPPPQRERAVERRHGPGGERRRRRDRAAGRQRTDRARPAEQEARLVRDLAATGSALLAAPLGRGRCR